MDPYLEDPEIWSGFHATFLSVIQEKLSPTLRPNYFVRIEERVYVTSEADPGYGTIIPDVRVLEARQVQSRPVVAPRGGLAIAEPIPVVELADPQIHEHFLEIRDRADRSVVTVIELLSPTNKVSGSYGREAFLRKRREILSTDAHWMEIDLLREGARSANLAASANAEYHVYLSRAGSPRHGFVWPMPLREKLPVIGVPLRASDADIALDLQDVFNLVYDRGAYDLDIDYRKDPIPALPAVSRDWARSMIKN